MGPGNVESGSGQVEVVLEALELYPVRLELEPDGVRATRGEPQWLQLPPATPAELRAERVASILQQAGEEMAWLYPGVSTLVRVPGCELQSTLAQQMGAQGGGPRVATTPARPPPHSALGRSHRVGTEGRLESVTYEIDLDPHRPQGGDRIGCWPHAGAYPGQTGPGQIQVQAGRPKYVRRLTVPVSQDAQQQMLVSDTRMPQPPCLLPGKTNHLPTCGRQSRPHLLGAVLTDQSPERPQDPRPHHRIRRPRTRTPCL